MEGDAPDDAREGEVDLQVFACGVEGELEDTLQVAASVAGGRWRLVLPLKAVGGCHWRSRGQSGLQVNANLYERRKRKRQPCLFVFSFFLCKSLTLYSSSFKHKKSVGTLDFFKRSKLHYVIIVVVVVLVVIVVVVVIIEKALEILWF